LRHRRLAEDRFAVCSSGLQQYVATIVPVPRLPGFGAYPPADFMTAMCRVFPVTAAPDFVTVPGLGVVAF
jgi:hypothetical protein